MSKLRWMLLAVLSFLLPLTTQSQEKSNTSTQGAGQGTGTVVSQARVGVMGGMVGGVTEPGLNQVHNLPFSADTIDETEQILADGTRIHRESHGRLFRDSQGRTRTENMIGRLAGNKLIIIISDPVEKTVSTLDSERKIAIVGHFKYIQRPGNNVKPASTGGMSADAPAKVNKIQNSHEDLGTTEIEGFTVRGTRTIHTIPAGEEGNDRPMTTTSERWFSDDLKIELLMKSERPQAGKYTHKLVNIRAGDPDPLLFQVPADYTTKEQQ